MVWLSSESAFWRQERLVSFVFFLSWKVLLNLPYFVYRVHVSFTTVLAKSKMIFQEKNAIPSFTKGIAAGIGERIGLARECGWMQKHLGTNPVSPRRW